MADLPIYFDPDDDISTDERSRRVNCLAKATFGSKTAAEAAVLQSEYQGSRVTGLSAYKCRHCEHWHISRRS